MEIHGEKNKKILQKFFSAKRYWEMIKSISSMNVESLKDNLDAQLKAERLFEILIQIIIDICSQITENSAGKSLEPNSECLKKLNNLGIISSELAEKGINLIKKRYIIMYQYGNINYAVLSKDLKKLRKFFIQFQNAILKWIESEEEK
jgi:uncharacterized protein YutE (UPF0331/DUF86 family)